MKYYFISYFLQKEKIQIRKKNFPLNILIKFFTKFIFKFYFDECFFFLL